MQKVQIYSSLENMINRLVRNPKRSLPVILLLAAAAYSNIFTNAYVMDDFSTIANWPLIQNPANWPRFFIGFIPPDGAGAVYSPFKTLFHSVIFLLSRGSPIGFHVAALLVQLAGTYIVYRIVSLLLENEFISFVAALLFALHPVHVEGITHMAAVTDTLGGVFLFFAFYCYIKAVGYEGSLLVRGSQSGASAKQNFGGWFDLVSSADYGRALLFGFLAIFTNELTLSLPFLLFFYDYFFSRSTRSLRFSFRRTAPFLLMALFYLLLKSSVLGGIGGRYLGDSFYLTMMLTIKAWAKYLWILFFPVTLTPDHVIADGLFSFNPKDFDSYAVISQSPLDPQTFISFVILAFLGAAGWMAWPKQRLISFCVGWFFISLLPAANLIPNSVYFAERYLYVASFSFCLLASYGIYGLYTHERFGSGTFKKSVVVACVVGLVVFYAARDLMRNRDWRDSVAISEAAVRANPQSAFLRNDLGIAYFQQGELKKAKESFTQAIAMRSNEPHFYFSAEETYSALEQYDTAITYLRKAIELNPQFAEAYFNFSSLLAYLHKESESAEYLQRAVELYKQQGRLLEAGQALTAMESYHHLSEKEVLDIIEE